MVIAVVKNKQTKKVATSEKSIALTYATLIFPAIYIDLNQFKCLDRGSLQIKVIKQQTNLGILHGNLPKH